MAKVPPNTPFLLVVHEPDVFESFGRQGILPSLTLAGHTHGGQVWLPLVGRKVQAWGGSARAEMHDRVLVLGIELPVR